MQAISRDPARRRQAHHGQQRSSARKRTAQADRRREIATESARRGIDPLTLIRERQWEVDAVVAAGKLAQRKLEQQLALEEERRRVAATRIQAPPPRPSRDSWW